MLGLCGAFFALQAIGLLGGGGGRGAVAKHELAGKIGVVASATLDARFGEIRVHDDRGNEILLHGCVRAGDAPLARGAKVLLVSYDQDKQLFWASACPEV